MQALRNLVSPEKKAFAKHLRKNMTRAEWQIWIMVCQKKMGVRFRRQSVLRGYIADFYCPAARLVVEADGRGHDAAQDKKRDASLAKIGLLTMRFSNEQILCKPLWVSEEIQKAVAIRAEKSSP